MASIHSKQFCFILAAMLAVESQAGLEASFSTKKQAFLTPVWQIQASRTEASLRGVCAVNRDLAWASGARGTFLRTTDGGKHWQAGRIPGAESLDFRDIQAFDAERACLLSAGRPARIYKTTDGGETWGLVYNNDSESIFFDAFAFFDENRGLAVGDPLAGRFMIITTADGANTWKELPPAQRPLALEGETAFAAGGTCLAVLGRSEAWFCTGGPIPRVLHSRDGGWTWEAAPSPLDSGTPSSGGFSLAFLDRKNGIMVGGDYKNETSALKNAAFSRDGGKSWTLAREAPPSGFRECVTFVPRTHPRLIIAVGPSGSDVSADGGRTWKTIPGPGFHSLSFSPRDGGGWAVGGNGTVARFDGQAALSLIK